MTSWSLGGVMVSTEDFIYIYIYIYIYTVKPLNRSTMGPILNGSFREMVGLGR